MHQPIPELISSMLLSPSSSTNISMSIPLCNENKSNLFFIENYKLKPEVLTTNFESVHAGQNS